jgi:hypothetical protein
LAELGVADFAAKLSQAYRSHARGPRTLVQSLRAGSRKLRVGMSAKGDTASAAAQHQFNRSCTRTSGYPATLTSRGGQMPWIQTLLRQNPATQQFVH